MVSVTFFYIFLVSNIILNKNMDKIELGSKTARGGFSNEKAICRKFNSWRIDSEA